MRILISFLLTIQPLFAASISSADEPGAITPIEARTNLIVAFGRFADGHKIALAGGSAAAVAVGVFMSKGMEIRVASIQSELRKVEAAIKYGPVMGNVHIGWGVFGNQAAAKRKVAQGLAANLAAAAERAKVFRWGFAALEVTGIIGLIIDAILLAKEVFTIPSAKAATLDQWFMTTPEGFDYFMNLPDAQANLYFEMSAPLQKFIVDLENRLASGH